MEGDGPTGASVLFQYHTIISILTQMERSTKYSCLSTIMTPMIDRLRLYQTEALHCDALLLATVLNPKFRLAFFEEKYPTYAAKAKELLQQTYDDYGECKDIGAAEKISQPHTDEVEVDPFEEVNIFASTENAVLSGEEELVSYLSGRFSCNGDILDWWRVRFPGHAFQSGSES